MDRGASIQTLIGAGRAERRAAAQTLIEERNDGLGGVRSGRTRCVNTGLTTRLSVAWARTNRVGHHKIEPGEHEGVGMAGEPAHGLLASAV